MHDPVVRFTLLYSILGVTAVGGTAALAWYINRSYWNRLRQAGNSRAKRRELQRKGKRR